jgi:hypothetical protein
MLNTVIRLAIGPKDKAMWGSHDMLHDVIWRIQKPVLRVTELRAVNDTAGPAWCSILRNTETHICEILADRGVRWAYRKKTGNDPLPEIVGDIKAWSAFTDHDIDAYWGLKAWPAV